jgi:hypothetical protein
VLSARSITHVILVIGISATFALAQQQVPHRTASLKITSRNWSAIGSRRTPKATVRPCDGSSRTISLAVASTAGYWARKTSSSGARVLEGLLGRLQARRMCESSVIRESCWV